MQIGVIGLGRMGGNITRRILSAMRKGFGAHVEPKAARKVKGS
jgi:6-phosphogluconate dehydrogenase (decarboxylating)